MAGFINLTHTNNKAINEVKQSVDSLRENITGVYRYKGSVQNYADLPANASVGDVYNVANKYDDYSAGTNFAWNGSQWDALGGSIEEIVIDAEMSDNSTNAVQNKVVKQYADIIASNINSEIADLERITTERFGSIEAQIGTIGESLDTINGEVI